jgi:hypothetical protein
MGNDSGQRFNLYFIPLVGSGKSRGRGPRPVREVKESEHRGLKPLIISESYAAPKGRSSTVFRGPVVSRVSGFGGRWFSRYSAYLLGFEEQDWGADVVADAVGGGAEEDVG